jgi:predicted DNA-binding helix-hairpin-helix protein
VITWQDRYAEWKALLDYLSEHQEELVKSGRMRALVICLQQHYQDMKRLKASHIISKKYRLIKGFESAGSPVASQPIPEVKTMTRGKRWS